MCEAAKEEKKHYNDVLKLKSHSTDVQIFHKHLCIKWLHTNFPGRKTQGLNKILDVSFVGYYIPGTQNQTYHIVGAQ